MQTPATERFAKFYINELRCIKSYCKPAIAETPSSVTNSTSGLARVTLRSNTTGQSKWKKGRTENSEPLTQNQSDTNIAGLTSTLRYANDKSIDAAREASLFLNTDHIELEFNMFAHTLLPLGIPVSTLELTTSSYFTPNSYPSLVYGTDLIWLLQQMQVRRVQDGRKVQSTLPLGIRLVTVALE